MRLEITKETAISYIKQIIFIMFTPPVLNSGYNSTRILQIRYFWIVFKNKKDLPSNEVKLYSFPNRIFLSTQ